MAERRLARVFVWKEGAAPDPEYVQQVLQVAAPGARTADPPVPITSEAVEEWPGDFWAYALPRLRQETDWTDPARYELAGWTGNDSRTGSRLFVASVYERPQPAAPAAVPETVTPPPAAPPAPAEPPASAGIGYGTPPSGFPVGEAEAVAPVIPPPPAAPNPPAPGAYPAAAPAPPPGYTAYPPAPPAPSAPPAGNAGYAPPGYPPAPPPPPAAYPPAAAYPPGYAPPATRPTAAYPPPAYVPPADAFPNQTGIDAAEVAGVYGDYYVGFGPRLVAGLVDGVLLGMIELLLILAAILLGRRLGANAANPDSVQALMNCLAVGAGLIVWVIYLADFWAWRGQTPGMIMMGMRVVTEQGSKPRLGQAFLRALGWVMSVVTLGVGFLLMLGDERKQGLADRLAGTYVVPVVAPPRPPPVGLPGYPAPAGGAESRPAPPPAAPVPSPAPAGPAPAPPAPLSAVAAPPAASPWSRPVTPASPPPDASSPDLVNATVPAEAPSLPAAAPPGDEAAAQFRRGLALLGDGAREPGGDRTLLIVEPEAGQAATAAFRVAADATPGSALYRYFVGVARRYGEGFGAALPEFEQAGRLDPTYTEVQMQLFFGPRWHDAFAYPAWSAQAGTLPGVLRALLPGRPGSRLVLVREGAARTVAVLIQTQRASWPHLPTAAMPTRIELLPVQTPSGLIVALYVALRDDPQNPYRGETFLNPAELPGANDDATQLGQNLVLALARQAHTYLIFVDETGTLLLNRQLVFDPVTRQNLAQAAPVVQAAAYAATARQQPMTLAAFQEAARWHMQQFPLDRVRV